MFDIVQTKTEGAELVDPSGLLIQKTLDALHPLDDPRVWLAEAAYLPPADVDIVQTQKWIDSLMGTTRDGESIYKLVWNGNRDYWTEYFLHVNNLGQPNAPVTKRPLVRYKGFRDLKTRKLVRDVFPPRWLILTRLEPEQFADTWKQESWFFDPQIGCMRQLRPDEPPKVFWLWYATIAKHNAYCCKTKELNYEKCYGEYVPPNYARELLENQRKSDLAEGVRSVFQKIDSSFRSEIEDENTGYALEMAELEADSAIYMENPMALLGIEATLKADVNGKQAEQIVKEYYDRQKQAKSKEI